MTPVVFDGTFGFLHEAPGDCAVVMCAAMGHEQLCASRGWRELAADIAAAGFPVLRFDWAGCGDATGSEDDPDQLAAWQASLRAAVREARARFQTNRIVLLGLRLGATLAACQAHELDAEGLALLAPAMSGRHYGRELAASNAVGTSQGSDDTHGGVEVAGFVTTRQTLTDLTGLDLRKLAQRPAARVALISPPEHIQADAIEAALAALGSEVTRKTLQGYEAFLADITLSRSPRETFADVIDWLKANFALTLRPAPSPAGEPASITTQDFREEALQFGPDHGLFAILCRPALETRDPLAVIILNTGLNPHVGWARLGVRFARRWAAQGIASLRLDVAGIGDSPPRPERAGLPLYDEALIEDVSAAIALMRARGYEKIVLFGACSGAWLAYQTQLRAMQASGIVLVNQARFIWRSDYSLSIKQGFKGNSFYAGRAFQLETWLRLLRGDINVRGLGMELARRLLRIARTKLGAVLRVSRTPNDTSLVRAAFRRLAAQGTPVMMAYSDDDEAADELFLHFGPGARRLRKHVNVSLARLGPTDHAISSKPAQDRLFSLTQAFLDARFKK
jgi:alpha-beta hydrolase superfamily lysophospholipase